MRFAVSSKYTVFPPIEPQTHTQTSKSGDSGDDGDIFGISNKRCTRSFYATVALKK
jgi:hypothetical protein